MEAWHIFFQKLYILGSTLQKIPSKRHAHGFRIKQLFKNMISKNGNQAEQRRVKFGNLIKEGFIEVLEGLLPGDKIIINPAPKLIAGDRIKVVGIK